MATEPCASATEQINCNGFVCLLDCPDRTQANPCSSQRKHETGPLSLIKTSISNSCRLIHFKISTNYHEIWQYALLGTLGVFNPCWLFKKPVLMNVLFRDKYEKHSLVITAQWNWQFLLEPNVFIIKMEGSRVASHRLLDQCPDSQLFTCCKCWWRL